MRSLISRGWFQAGVLGIVLFIITDLALRYTQNLNYLPTLILLGAFVVPVAFAAYFYRQENLLDRNIHNGIPLIQASIMFLVGAIVGTIIAGVLENTIAFTNDFANFLSVSAIEEAAKLIFPVVVFLQARYRSEADGLVFGIATGVGFAALETMGYSLFMLVASGGSITDLEQILIIRGLFSPLGHAAWTGLICGAIWHYQGQRKKLVLMAIAYFLLAVVLHTLWNLASSTGQYIIMLPTFIVIGGIGIFIVMRHLRHARQKLATALNQSSDSR